jgi:hypothetical protein
MKPLIFATAFLFLARSNPSDYATARINRHSSSV